MSTDTANCFKSGLVACSNIVKQSSGSVASSGPLVMKGLLFAICVFTLVLILKSQYETWGKDKDYTIADLIWNGIRAACVITAVILFTNL